MKFIFGLLFTLSLFIPFSIGNVVAADLIVEIQGVDSATGKPDGVIRIDFLSSRTDKFPSKATTRPFL